MLIGCVAGAQTYFILDAVLGVATPCFLSKVCEFLNSETHLALGFWLGDDGPVFLRLPPISGKHLKESKVS